MAHESLFLNIAQKTGAVVTTAQTLTRTYRAFEIDAELETKDGQTQVTRLTIGIKGQPKRIPIVPDVFTSVGFTTAHLAAAAALKQAQQTIDGLLDAGQNTHQKE